MVSGFGSIFGLKRVQPEFSKGTRGLGKGPTYHANVNRELAWGVHGWTFVLRAVHNTAKPQSESMAMAEVSKRDCVGNRRQILRRVVQRGRRSRRPRGNHRSARQPDRRPSHLPRPGVTIPGRLVMLCDRACILARSDRPETRNCPNYFPVAGAHKTLSPCPLR